VGRIEAGLIDPRASTLERLLRACGYELDVQPRLGMGIDRSLIRQMLERTPRERIEHAAGAAEEISRMRGRIRRRTS
jgi:predicted transcriptional regulator